MMMDPRINSMDQYLHNIPTGKIVFSAQVKYGNTQIFSVNADGSDLVQLTHTDGFNDSPAWSPDGSEIVFSSDRFGNWDICIMDADGGHVVQVTKKEIGKYPSMDFHPSWSPDGQKIVFQSDRDAKEYNYGRKYRIGSKDRFFWDVYQLYIIGRDGSSLTRITNDPFRNDWTPSWSPDGKKIIFASANVTRSSPDVDRAQSRIEMIDLDGRSRKVVAEFEGDATSLGFVQPAWSPGGNQIAFTEISVKNGEVVAELLFTGINSEAFGSIKKSAVFGTNPCWSPDGQHLVFDSTFYEEDRSSIYIMNFNGNEIAAIANIPYNSGDPKWI
jgi:TolB protein